MILNIILCILPEEPTPLALSVAELFLKVEKVA